jgi:hypothetical protein
MLAARAQIRNIDVDVNEYRKGRVHVESVRPDLSDRMVIAGDRRSGVSGRVPQ